MALATTRWWQELTTLTAFADLQRLARDSPRVHCPCALAISYAYYERLPAACLDSGRVTCVVWPYQERRKYSHHFKVNWCSHIVPHNTSHYIRHSPMAIM